jgi:hypothetical protein
VHSPGSAQPRSKTFQHQDDIFKMTFVRDLPLINSNTLLKFIADSLLCALLTLVRVVVRNREGGLRG